MRRADVVLGINGLNDHSHDAAACLVVDGVAVAAAAEERYSGVKHERGFPLRAIRFCLEQAGIPFDRVDRIAYPFSPRIRFVEGLRFLVANLPRSLALITPAPLQDLAEKRSIPARLAAAFGGEARAAAGRMRYVEHHRAHAAAAFHGSGFFESAILTLDGIGEMDSGWLGVGAGSAVHPLRRLRFPASAGLLYRAVTEYLGFRSDGDEGKVMGLAPYGDERYLADFRPLVELLPDGFRLDPRFFRTLYYPVAGQPVEYVTAAFRDRFGLPRAPGEPLEPRHMAVARALQDSLETIVLHLARRALALTGMRTLCLAGGVALNSCANGRLLALPGLAGIHIQPAAADDGAALGAALEVSKELVPGRRPTAPAMPLLGHDIAADPLPAPPAGVRVTTPADPVAALVPLLAAGRVVAVARGRAEFGPRALGARSILADPRDPDMRRRLNDEVKGREWFRPYAPVVPLERAAELFAGARPSPHMLLVFPVRPKWRDRIPAVTHVDGTARLQTVTADAMPFLHALATAFGAATGVPCLLNTSFNGPGKPLVNTAEDALATFRARPIDALLLGDTLYEKA